MEKGKFEQSWREAFDGAEVPPSGSVWTNVELELEKAAGGKMKQRLLFYKLLAAASLVFAMGIAGIYYVTSSENESPVLAEADKNSANEIKPPPSETSIAGSEKHDKSVDQSERQPIKHELAQRKQFITENQQSGTPASSRVARNSEVAAVNGPDLNSLESAPLIGRNQADHSGQLFPRPKTKLTEAKAPVLVFPEKEEQESTADPGMLLLAMMKDEEQKYKEEKKLTKENIWTSVGFAAGSFNPNTSSSTYMQSNSLGGLGNTYADAKPSSGSSYSLGLQVGGKISNRIVLQGGVAYLTQNASYTSNVASLEATTMRANLNDHLYSTNQQSINVSAYGVNSNLQFVSVPVQAGYLIIDKNFGWQMNGGVATDFFIVNTLTPEVDYVSKTSQGAGSDSPYRTVNFSGLIGTEFSYKFSDRYRLALNPGIRYALNSIYKSDVSAEVAPITYDVALRFRYIFK